MRTNRLLTGKTVVVLAAAGILAAACGSSSANSVSPPPTDHVLHVSFLQDPGQPPDPDIYYAGQGLLLTTNMYEGLLQYQAGTDTPKIVPVLATSWTASPDNKVYTFQLREGVVFHDGTPFTSAAVKASFDRRLAVNQSPSYMVADSDVTTDGDYGVTITLKDSNSAFLAYLASAYGPKMMSPTALKDQAGSDNVQTYLRTHDIGTGPYTLKDASVGSHYAMQAFDKYWGPKPYFTSVDIPVLTDLSTEQLQFDKGQLAVMMHDVSASATQSYLKNSKVKTYSLPTLSSNYLYVNPSSGFLTTVSNRMALLQAIDVKTIFNQVFAGRGTVGDQSYPARMIAPDLAKQNIPNHQSSALQNLVKTLPTDQKTIAIGYDSAQADSQLVANIVSAQLLSLGLTAKVQSYPTSQIYGWATDAKGAPEMLLYTGWPDAAPPYTWAHIAWDDGGGLNFLHCSDPQISAMLPEGLRTGSEQIFDQIGQLAAQTGCWDNLVNQDDFMVAHPWLKGVEQSHVVTAPNTLSVAGLSVG